MIISVTANIKLDSRTVLKAGRYDDRNKPFHSRVYTLIEQGSRHIEVIQGSMSQKQEVAQEPEAEEKMVDDGVDVTNLEEEQPKKTKKSTSKKASGGTKRSRKSE